MSRLAGLAPLRARVAAAFRARLLGVTASSTAPAEPIAGPMGPAAWLPPEVTPGTAAGPEVAAPRVPDRWGTADRGAHTLAWFAELARRHAAGDATAAPRAVSALGAWLRHDIPGKGPGWEHPFDAAIRLVHLAAGFAWLGPAAPEPLRAHAAGSAAWHIAELRGRLPLGRGDGHRRVAHLVGVFVGALTFPAIPGAREAWSEAASGLGPAFEALVLPDGGDAGGAPRWLERSAWLGAFALAVGRVNGVALPRSATSGWVGAARFLDRLAGDIGTLPPLGEAPPLPMLGEGPGLPAVLRTLAAHWRLDAPEATPPDDPRLRWFGAAHLAVPTAGPTGPALGTHVRESGAPRAASRATPWWSMWTFHEDGLAIAAASAKGEPLRVIVHAQSRSEGPFAHPAPMQLLVDLGARPLLVDPGAGTPARAAHDGLVLRGREPTNPRLDVARVDGKKARLEGGASLGGNAHWHREVRLDQLRIRVTDRLEATGGEVSLRWSHGPDWEVSGDGREWTLRSGPFTVAVELPLGLAWRHEGGAWLGEGALPAGGELRTNFEVR